MGRTDVPLGQGVKSGDRPINQKEWLGDYTLERYKGKVIEDGVGAMIDAITGSPKPVTLCIIGPQTNLKAALERSPAIAKNARVVCMAGSVYIGYDGKEGRAPEWNVFRDIPAARAVFAAPWAITMAPLDVCGTLRLEGARYAAVASSKNPRAAVTIANYEQWSNRKQHPKDASSILFDTVAAYLTCEEADCEMQTINLRIDDQGNTLPDEEGRPVRCALKWKDRDAFEALLLKRVTE
jgi:inosine-uridine nucleoside N-ribohydrolase